MKLNREQAVQTAVYIVKQSMVAASVTINRLDRNEKLAMVTAIVDVAIGVISDSSPLATDVKVDACDLIACIMQSSNPFNLDLAQHFEVVADKLWQDPRAEMRATLRSLPTSDLTDILMDIYDRLNCDEHGFNPSESVAASSAGDFVDSCNHTFAQVMEKYGKTRAS